VICSHLAVPCFCPVWSGRKKLASQYSPPELMCYTLIVGTAAIIPVGLPALVAQNWSHVTWHTWLIVPYSVLFPIYFTYSIWNWAIGKRGVSYVTLFSYIVPIFGGLAGLLCSPKTAIGPDWRGCSHSFWHAHCTVGCPPDCNQTRSRCPFRRGVQWLE